MENSEFIWSFGGDPVALLAVADLAALDVEQFTALRAACTAASTKLVVVAGNTVAAAGTLWKKLGLLPEDPLLLCDEKGQFLPALLSRAGAVSFGQGMGMRQRVIVLDPNQRVATTFDTQALLAATEAMAGPCRFGALKRRRRPASEHGHGAGDGPAARLRAGFLHPAHPAVGRGDHKDGGVSSRYGNVDVSALKQTEDYTIVEPMMLKAVSDRLAYRIGPELTKVFAFDREFTFDAHVVLSYSAEGQHFFAAHRDNGAPTTADRASPCR